MTLEEKIDYIGGINNFDVRAFPIWACRAENGRRPVRRPQRRRPPPPWPAASASPLHGIPSSPSASAQASAEMPAPAASTYMLGPGVNIYRSPRNGRNFEYFGEDPFLAARIAVGYINGMQTQGVSATVKHYMGNNSEYRPPRLRLHHRRAHHARDLSARLRSRRQGGATSAPSWTPTTSPTAST